MSRLGERNHRITTGVQMLIERRSKCQGFRVGVSTLLEKKLCDQERMHGSYSAALMMVGKDTCRSHQSHDLYEDDLHFALAMVRRAKLRVHSFGSLHFTSRLVHGITTFVPCLAERFGGCLSLHFICAYPLPWRGVYQSPSKRQRNVRCEILHSLTREQIPPLQTKAAT
jgi:hypothetical protein